MGTTTRKMAVAVTLIRRRPKAGKPVQVIEPGTVLRGVPRKEIDDLTARGAVQMQDVIVEDRNSGPPNDPPKGGGGEGGGKGEKKPDGGGE